MRIPGPGRSRGSGCPPSSSVGTPAGSERLPRRRSRRGRARKRTSIGRSPRSALAACGPAASSPRTTSCPWPISCSTCSGRRTRRGSCTATSSPRTSSSRGREHRDQVGRHDGHAALHGSGAGARPLERGRWTHLERGAPAFHGGLLAGLREALEAGSDTWQRFLRPFDAGKYLELAPSNSAMLIVRRRCTSVRCPGRSLRGSRVLAPHR